MAIQNRMRTEPIPVVRQSRTVPVRAVTTVRPGLVVPIFAANLLRMDNCNGRINVAVQMDETYEVLLNRMSARLNLWFVPHIANERFERNIGIFERSFAGQPKTNDEGADVVPFIETHAFPETAGSHAVYKALGLSAKPGALVNTAYQEAYNQIVNQMARQRSKSLPMRELDDSSLAAAFWGRNAFSEIVPDFDDAMIAGEVLLSVVDPKMPVKGIAKGNGNWGGPRTGYESGETAATTYAASQTIDGSNADNSWYVEKGEGVFPAIYAEFASSGVSLSLANLDQAREIVKWAKKREGYEGHLDSWTIDAMMQGIEIEELAWMMPMLIDSQTVEIKQMQRMATDGASLEDGVANGVAIGSLGVNIPGNKYGGVIMATIEVLPEQLYERQADPWFTATGVDDLPNYMQDALNPMPVVEVLNKEVDVDHDTPDVQFGWAKRNWKWGQWPTRVGGDLYAPDADAATNVARRMIYPTDVENPQLTLEFYRSTTLGMSPFVDQTKDPIKLGIGGSIQVNGLTIIGEVHESEANYDEVRSEIPPLQNPKA